MEHITHVSLVDGNQLTEYLPNQIGGMASAISPFFIFNFRVEHLVRQ